MNSVFVVSIVGTLLSLWNKVIRIVTVYLYGHLFGPGNFNFHLKKYFPARCVVFNSKSKTLLMDNRATAQDSSIQKDSVQCTVGTVDISYLLSTICCCCFEKQYHTIFGIGYLSCKASYSYFSLSQINNKPNLIF